MTVLQPTQCYRRVSDCSTYSPHSATGESVTVLLPTQCYRRVSDCSTAYSPHSATGESVTVLQPTAHTVLQESQ